MTAAIFLVRDSTNDEPPEITVMSKILVEKLAVSRLGTVRGT
jgi:hypothetical protein